MSNEINISGRTSRKTCLRARTSHSRKQKDVKKIKHVCVPEKQTKSNRDARAAADPRCKAAFACRVVNIHFLKQCFTRVVVVFGITAWLERGTGAAMHGHGGPDSQNP
jgi:hypothetical protein